MKNATLTNGDAVCADANAPQEALCPVCGRPVFLRSRQKMGSSERTYFWQHERGASRECRPQRRVRRPMITKHV